MIINDGKYIIRNAIEAVELFESVCKENNILNRPDYSGDSPNITTVCRGKIHPIITVTYIFNNNSTFGVSAHIDCILIPLSKEERQFANIATTLIQSIYEKMYGHRLDDLRSKMLFLYREFPDNLALKMSCPLNIGFLITKAECISIINEVNEYVEEAILNGHDTMEEIRSKFGIS